MWPGLVYYRVCYSHTHSVGFGNQHKKPTHGKWLRKFTTISLKKAVLPLYEDITTRQQRHTA